ncbi:LLM class flavin-dependent oxidoreductase [Rhabdothermincola salaria]|uniref:LLM class flavin-dependent oxidoreductase n=1 Tax=Rhabdothermincola salaria TaxID=2903142 RepID=UPI001E59BE2F|nr:LLM class flavin-dependent oxidoreductase [Rhabdothermincola salaria]MCD9625434.1 LLM class flavin-dependent oxidoreductase [Rhabdothermincola salaria]
MTTTPPFAPGSISLRLYPHNELDAPAIVEHLCAMAARAIDVGFDGVMTSEHHGGFAGYLPNPLQVTGFQLAAMDDGWAAPCPLLMPLRPVGLLAEEVAWLDARFPGRVGLGVGPGSLELDFTVVDMELSEAVPRFKADLPRLAAMLRGADLGVLEGDRALAGLAADGRRIPMLTTAMSPAAARRAASVGAGVLYDGASVLSRLRRLSDEHRAAGGTAPRVLLRRVWIGEPPEEAFAAQFEVYQGYTPAERQSHWEGSGWMTGDDPAAIAQELATAVHESGSDALNLRIHAPGIAAERAHEQIEVLGAELLPRLRPLLAAGG